MAAKFNINSNLFGRELLNILPQHTMSLGLPKPEPRDFDRFAASPNNFLEDNALEGKDPFKHCLRDPPPCSHDGDNELFSSPVVKLGHHRTHVAVNRQIVHVLLGALRVLPGEKHHGKIAGTKALDLVLGV